MFWWFLPVFLLSAVAAFGFLMLRRICARPEKSEGWEDRRVAESGDAAWQAAWQAGRDWLARCETEEVEVQSDDGFMLHGLLVPHIAPRATVILFHGWRSSWEMDFLCALPFLHGLRLQCLFVDQRAQGDSEGRFMTLGVRERTDVPVWVDYAASRFGAKHPIFLQGASMGASTVTMASAYHFSGNVRGLIADCGFTSPHEVVSSVWRDKTPFPAHFAVWLLDLFARWFADFSLRECDAADALARTEYPVLFLHGAADKFVPSYMTRRAYEACGSEKTLLLVEGAGHCMSYLVGRSRVEAAYRDFIEKCLEDT